MNLPLLTMCPQRHVSMTGVEPLGMSLICRPTNQSAKPPSDGVLLSWRSDHEISLNRRLLAESVTRVAHGRTTNRLLDKALPFHPEPMTEHRIHDGQDREWLAKPFPAHKPIKAKHTAKGAIDER